MLGEESMSLIGDRYSRQMPWDPDRYLRFADHRARPGLELITRMPDVAASTVVDLGCGTGNLTAVLAERWPDAHVVGIDSSSEMIERARTDHPDIEWRVADVNTWLPEGPVDVIYSNATLHWMGDHDSLFGRLRSHVAAGGVIAVQMPDNWNAPTHRVPAIILDEGYWRPEALSALMRDRLSDPGDYVRWLQPADVDMWRTTYYQQLSGEDPVWTWVTGSLLLPVLAAFDDIEAERFSAVCRRRYREAYPQDAAGMTLMPFSRLFFVGVVP
jgi:trans-aconitate 2-methyltransferase